MIVSVLLVALASVLAMPVVSIWPAVRKIWLLSPPRSMLAAGPITRSLPVPPLTLSVPDGPVRIVSP